jgi:hypothetical protein
MRDAENARVLTEELRRLAEQARVTTDQLRVEHDACNRTIGEIQKTIEQQGVILADMLRSIRELKGASDEESWRADT